MSSKLLEPDNLVIISCWDPKDPKPGPYLQLVVNDTKDQGVTIDCGLTIIGLIFNNIQIHSGKTVKGNEPREVARKAPITLESVTVNKTHICFNGVPFSDIVDAFNGKQLIMMDKIKELSALDENKWSIQAVPQNQPPEEAGKPLGCSFNISGSWKTIFTPTKDEANMEPFKLVTNMPLSWEDIWKEIVTAIANAIEDAPVPPPHKDAEPQLQPQLPKHEHEPDFDSSDDIDGGPADEAGRIIRKALWDTVVFVFGKKRYYPGGPTTFRFRNQFDYWSIQYISMGAFFSCQFYEVWTEHLGVIDTLIKHLQHPDSL
ncbi:hypothetical protein D9619_012374 [Psilocybe cf. subviscida]|uniref:Uncharacterized protein n=1 Tax=Psilocybe cf. subviscida TaxID=2480587 RepID=A0A8H5AR11_9AGAR|nr:hypothetical protein D9619_012374 [Psilocybe cf. subviscida]